MLNFPSPFEALILRVSTDIYLLLTVYGPTGSRNIEMNKSNDRGLGL